VLSYFFLVFHIFSIVFAIFLHKSQVTQIKKRTHCNVCCNQKKHPVCNAYCNNQILKIKGIN
jgi:hypothetical protein